MARFKDENDELDVESVQKYLIETNYGLEKLYDIIDNRSNLSDYSFIKAFNDMLVDALIKNEDYEDAIYYRDATFCDKKLTKRNGKI